MAKVKEHQKGVVLRKVEEAQHDEQHGREVEPQTSGRAPSETHGAVLTPQLCSCKRKLARASLDKTRCVQSAERWGL